MNANANKELKQLIDKLDKPQLVHSDIKPIIEWLKTQAGIEVKQLGVSFLQRDINLIKFGNGATKLLAWTQMHGDEPTATSAVFDLIHSLHFEPSALVPFQLSDWASYFTFYIIPMVNPDGAEVITRQNAQSIDINRDALALQSPEGRILMKAIKDIAPDIAFNLHDQSDYYQCGDTKNPTTIGFLAPAFDIEKNIDDSRQKAMLIIDYMKQAIEPEIPNQIARYDDTFAERCFGDNVAKQKISTILIESGAAIGDANRQLARKLNVKSVLSAMEYLHPSSTNKFEVSVSNYFDIPENYAKGMADVVFRDLHFIQPDHDLSYSASICVSRDNRFKKSKFVSFIGDGTGIAGLKEYDARNWCFIKGQTYHVDRELLLNDAALFDLIKQGYIAFYDPQNLLENRTQYPIEIATELPHVDIKNHTGKPIQELNQQTLPNKNSQLDTYIHVNQNAQLNQPAHWIIGDKDEPTSFIGAVINGELLLLKD